MLASFGLISRPPGAVSPATHPTALNIMTRAHTYGEIASSFELWQEYFDHKVTMSCEEFDTMSHADKVAALLIEEALRLEDLVPTVADLLEQTAISNGVHRWACEGGSIEVPADVLRPILEHAYDETNPNWTASVAYDDSIGFWVA